MREVPVNLMKMIDSIDLKAKPGHLTNTSQGKYKYWHANVCIYIYIYIILTVVCKLIIGPCSLFLLAFVIRPPFKHHLWARGH